MVKLRLHKTQAVIASVLQMGASSLARFCTRCAPARALVVEIVASSESVVCAAPLLSCAEQKKTQKAHSHKTQKRSNAKNRTMAQILRDPSALRQLDENETRAEIYEDYSQATPFERGVGILADALEHWGANDDGQFLRRSSTAR